MAQFEAPLLDYAFGLMTDLFEKAGKFTSEVVGGLAGKVSDFVETASVTVGNSIESLSPSAPSVAQDSPSVSEPGRGLPLENDGLNSQSAPSPMAAALASAKEQGCSVSQDIQSCSVGETNLGQFAYVAPNNSIPTQSHGMVM